MAHHAEHHRSLPDPQFYELTDENQGPPPVTLAEAKAHLKLGTDADDDLLSLLVNACSEAAEKYAGRELRVNTWTLVVDAFEDRIRIRRDPVAAITSIQYQDEADATQTVATTVWYLKRGQQFSEVLLQDGQEWPTDVVEREAAITITFTTQAHRYLEQARVAILRHVQFLYENRGDCDPSGPGAVVDAMHQSGAARLLDGLRIARV